MIINIYSKGTYPANMLSNFAPHRFDFDGFYNIPCMEAFLQSLKFENIEDQKQVLYMNAKDAKTIGCNKRWKRNLFWKGQKVDRFSKEYIRFIKSAYARLLLNVDFKKALIDSNKSILIHTVGKTFRKKTVLTWWEFVWILYEMRKEARQNERD